MTQFVSLGVQFDLSLLSGNLLVFGCKPGRVPAIRAFGRGAIGRRKCSSLELDSLRRKLQFAESQTFCRLACYVLSLIQAAFKVVSSSAFLYR